MTSLLRPLRTGLAVCLTVLLGVASGTVAVSESQAFSTASYISQAASAAKTVTATYGVPASVTIAQSILESGWGRSDLSERWNNYFGIKCTALTSPHQSGCINLKSAEYYNGVRGIYVSGFRTYKSMTKSFLDYGRLLDRADRYNEAFRYTRDPNQFIREVARAGYATDPRYADSVIRLMKAYDLYRFDAKPAARRAVDSKAAFISSLTVRAQQNQLKYGIKPSVTIAQAIESSNFGTSTLAKKAKNLFGIQCVPDKRKPPQCLKLNGTRYRTYPSLTRSVIDHGALLGTTARYRAAKRQLGNTAGYLSAIVKAGWSRKKGYARTILGLITKYRLTRFDLAITKGSLSKGDLGAKVQATQYLLAARGATVPATGQFLDQTLKAVKAFQKGAGIPVTGKVDPLTLNRLIAVVRPNSKGNFVGALHTLLRARTLPVTGSFTFGAATKASVQSLQKKYRFRADGVVTARLWAKLFA